MLILNSIMRSDVVITPHMGSRSGYTESGGILRWVETFHGLTDWTALRRFDN